MCIRDRAEDDHDYDTGQRLTSHPDLASSIVTGQRIPSYNLINHAQATTSSLASLLPSTGKWHVLVFAGDLTHPPQFDLVQRLGTHLDTLTRKYERPHNKDRPSATANGTAPAHDSPIEILTVHSCPRNAVDLLSLHETYHPWDERLGWDYWKVHADSAEAWDSSTGGAYAVSYTHLTLPTIYSV